jgi:hypothetical protein
MLREGYPYLGYYSGDNLSPVDQGSAIAAMLGPAGFVPFGMS